MADWQDPLSAVRRTFWAHVAVCLAAALLAFFPDRTDFYDSAINELQLLGSVKLPEEAVFRAVRRHMDTDYGKKLHDVIKRSAENHGLTLEPDALNGGLRYLFIQSGPKSIIFEQDISSLLALANRIASQEPYTVAVPDLSSLERELSAKLTSIDPGFTHIVTVELDCSFDGEPCSGIIQIDDSTPGVPFRVVDLLFRRITLGPLPFTSLDIVKTLNREIDAHLFKLPITKLVSTQIVDKSRTQAIVELEKLKSESQQPLAVFGFAFAGSVAQLAAPPLLAAVGIFLLISFQSLYRLRPPHNIVRMSFIPPFFDGLGGAMVRFSLLIFFPLVVDVGLIIRTWDASWQTSSWVVTWSVAHGASAVGAWRWATVIACPGEDHMMP